MPIRLDFAKDHWGTRSALALLLPALLIGLSPASARAVSWVGGIGMTNEIALDLGQQEPNRSAGRIAGGSAVLVHPKWAFTARHFNSTGRRVTFFQTGQGANIAGTVTAHAASDLALIELDTPALGSGRSYHKPYFRDDEVGKFMWKAGYGRFGVNASPSNPDAAADGRRRAVTNVVSRVGTDHGFPVNSFGQMLGFSRTNAGGNGITQYEGSTAPGDSGGPAYVEHDDQWYVAGVTYGAIGGWGFAETRISSNLDWIEQTTGVNFAYPTDLQLAAEWDASTISAPDQSTVATWTDLSGQRAFATQGRQPRPRFIEHATPSGAPALEFTGQRLTLDGQSNPISGAESFSLAMAVRIDDTGVGDGGQWWENAGLLDADLPGDENDWGLAIDEAGQVGFGIGADINESYFASDTTVRSTSNSVGGWRLIAATWDGSTADGQLNLYLNTSRRPVQLEGPRYADVARDVADLVLGGTSDATGATFDGAVAALRLYEGALAPGEVNQLFGEWTDELLTPTLPGDYNADGQVDALDYAVWRENLGAPGGTLPNDAHSGTIGSAQFATWQANYGASLSSQVAVPEPGGLLLVLLGGSSILLGGRRVGWGRSR